LTSPTVVCAYIAVWVTRLGFGGTAWGGDKKVVMGLSSWPLLGAFLAAFVGIGAYMYGGLDTSSANQAGVGEYVIPALEAAQPKQQSGGPSQSTNNSSSGTEAPS